MRRKFVTAFAGRRDAYQLPLALAEAGRLERFVTTFYMTSRLERMTRAARRLAPALASRRVSGLCDRHVRAMIVPELLEQLGRRAGIDPTRYWRVIDRAISRAAGAEADRAHADLVLYEPYAFEAFDREYRDHKPRKILFHFHPHPQLEAEIYAADLRLYPRATPWLSHDAGGCAAGMNKSHGVWQLADLILCASSFTRRSLIHAGAAPDLCKVVPYGIDAPPTPPRRECDGAFRVIFVGSGIQRKGLHHLLEAWRQARLPARSELVIVSRTIDPQLRDRIADTPRCRFVPGLNGAELQKMYDMASLLAVPSLAEGFGQVYLEALSRGCPVLGTSNTGLPDLGNEEDGVFLVEPSNVDQLRERLSALSERLVQDNDVGIAAWRTATRFTWQRFRSSLMEAIA